MSEDEKMFQIGIWALSAVVLLTVTLQVCYRTQNRARDHVHRTMVETQHEIAEQQANFASYVRPEILRNLVTSISPHAEVISFHKTIAIDDIPIGDTAQ